MLAPHDSECNFCAESRSQARKPKGLIVYNNNILNGPLRKRPTYVKTSDDRKSLHVPTRQSFAYLHWKGSERIHSIRYMQNPHHLEILKYGMVALSSTRSASKSKVNLNRPKRMTPVGQSVEGIKSVVDQNNCLFSEPRKAEKSLPLINNKVDVCAGSKTAPLSPWNALVESNVKAPIDNRLTMEYKKLRGKKASNNWTVSKSPIHGNGLFARREFARGDLVIEYTGQVISKKLCERREKNYEVQGIGCYFFKIDKEVFIDATKKGNAARFINHGCAWKKNIRRILATQISLSQQPSKEYYECSFSTARPNCRSKIVEIFGRKRIFIFAIRKIHVDEELTYDYKFDMESIDKKIHCTCGAAKCRKYLN